MRTTILCLGKSSTFYQRINRFQKFYVCQCLYTKINSKFNFLQNNVAFLLALPSLHSAYFSEKPSGWVGRTENLELPGISSLSWGVTHASPLSFFRSSAAHLQLIFLLLYLKRVAVARSLVPRQKASAVSMVSSWEFWLWLQQRGMHVSEEVSC